MDFHQDVEGSKRVFWVYFADFSLYELEFVRCDDVLFIRRVSCDPFVNLLSDPFVPCDSFELGESAVYSSVL